MTITERIFIDNEWHVVSTDDDEDEDPSPSLTVDTDTATNVTDTSATVTGDLTELKELDEASVWFEWRETTDDTWAETETEVRTTTGSFSEELSELTVDTEYEFRAMAENQDEEIDDAGHIETFTTVESSETGDIVAEEEVFAVWAIDEGGGDLVADAGDGGHDGSITGDVAWAGWEGWPGGWAIENEDPADGADYVETTTWGDFFGGTDAVVNDDFALALAFWTTDDGAFMISATHNSHPLMRVGTRHAWGWANREGFKFYLSANPGTEDATGELNSSIDVTDGEAYHVVVNKRGAATDDWELYVNGEKDTGAMDQNTDGSDLGDFTHDATTDVTFMADTSEQDHREAMTGGIGYIAIWERALTSEEIDAEYDRMPFAGADP